MFRSGIPNNKKTLIKDDPKVDAFLDFSAFVRIAAVGYLLYEAYEQPTKSVGQSIFKSYALCLNMLALLSCIYGRYRTQQEHQTLVKSVKQELKRANSTPKSLGLDNFNPSVFKPLKKIGNVRLRYEDSRHRSITWQPGRGELLQQITLLDTIFNSLPPGIEEGIRENITRPQQKSQLHMLRPHVNRILDMPSKTRSLLLPSIMMAVNRLLRTLLSSSLNITESSLFPVMVSLAVAGITTGESYILNKRREALALEGFTKLYGPYFGKSPTCIGQQINSELVLYPNHSIREAFLYFRQAHDYLECLENHGKLQTPEIPNDIIDDIYVFFNYCRANMLVKDHGHRVAYSSKYSLN